MSVGETLIARVAEQLSVHEPKTIKAVHLSMIPRVSHVAVRAAVKKLVERGQAKRRGKPGQHYTVLAIPETAVKREVIGEFGSLP